MGSSSSKFRRYLQNGDEYAALQAFQSSPELQHNLDPNSSYGDSLKHNTPLHLVAKHAMKPLLRIFLTELNGNPNKKNALDETPLHLVCQGDITRSIANLERRAACLNLLLQWHTTEEKLDLACEDFEGNTALHYAAESGLKNCVEILVSHGAPLFICNKSFETVCDLAEKNRHEDIAQYLEVKMLFHTDGLDNVQLYNEITTEDVESGLRAQDLQEAKDQLLVETSDMFHVPLFTAEVLLRNHEWSRQSLLDAWMKDPVACCRDAGVSPPSSAINFSTTQDSLKMCCEQIQNEYQNETLNSPARTVVVKEEIVCDICMISISSESLIQVPCLHQFCENCWTTYLTAKIVEGEAHHIFCPAYECPHLVPVDVIERLVSADMVKRYLQFDIKAFVESNPTMKWCPYPGCARAVKVPKIEKVNDEILAISFNSPPPAVSHAVDCGNGHYFCWECLGEAHAPSGCEKWREWHNKIAEIKPQELKNTYSETEAAENSLWMVTNSKPCPNCKCPIQKNEGCNHMKCTKCKYEFCWVCLESWKRHGPGTGGYFRCNRHDAAKRAEVKTETLITQAEEHNKHMQELKRFLQYYTRFKNHENSYKFEEPFLKAVQEKVSVLLASVDSDCLIDTNFTFLEESIYELLRARRILCGAYVYGFYLEDNGYNKTIFEYLQNDLEEITVKLSEAVARTYLQTPQSKIIHMTSQVKRKRLDLLTAVYKGLIPPETPPSMRKSRKRRLPGLMGMDPEEDPQISQAILESLENIDPSDPWVIDESGRHTNVAAVCDWPDYDSDEEGNSNPLLSSVLGVCSRDGCNRPRAKNCRTGTMHEFCSLTCKHWDVIKSPDAESFAAHIDPAMDMLIALEMSKLNINFLRSEEIDSSRNVEPEDLNSEINLVTPETQLPEELPPLVNSNDSSKGETQSSDVASNSNYKPETLEVDVLEQPQDTMSQQFELDSISSVEQNRNIEISEQDQDNGCLSSIVIDLDQSLNASIAKNLNSTDDLTIVEPKIDSVVEQQDNIRLNPSEHHEDDKVSVIIEQQNDNINLDTVKPEDTIAETYEQLDNTESNMCEDVSNSTTVISTKSSPLKLLFPFDKETPDLNFYLKNSCESLSENINVKTDKNFSKTDKELFKVFQQNSDTNGS